ncbi:PepSY domain-containing protein [Pseudoxanthomonas sp. LjRoot143]|uniref:PepSY domain-containing protein n=1 Tax=Pseudoxanthomonas sp. LjRoot143 TaxID=3342266 RepID=UPI003F4F7EEC
MVHEAASDPRLGPCLSDWITTLHFGSVWGLPMKVLVSAIGVIIYILSLTVVVVWWREAHCQRRRLEGPSLEGPADRCMSAIGQKSRSLS